MRIGSSTRMTRGLRAMRVVGALGLLSGTIARPAVAAGPDDAAQQLFRQGVEAARQERWPDAFDAFEKAYALSGRPVVLINLAGAQARTGRLEEAARNYRRILDDATSAETAPFRKAAADILPTLEARIPRIRLHMSELGATDLVEIDGQQIAPEHIADWQALDPGAHTLVVKRSGVERARVAFSLAERESHEISLPEALLPPVLVPALAPAAAAAPPGISLVASEPRAEEPARRAWWKSPRVWVAVAAVAAATTLVTIFVVDRREQLYSGNVPPGVVTVE
jgi:hypothetical protein